MGVLALLLPLAVGVRSAPGAERRLLTYAPAPVENPLKGLVPYAGDGRDQFPHTLEFDYLPLSALVLDHERYDWKPLDQLLNGIAARGHQAVFRIYLEYPGRKGVIPPFLVREGLKVHRYLNTNTQPEPPAEIETPDYGDPKLRRVLQQFIAALGRRYDGDARIGFLTAGLLGTWGEWHTYPREELFAGKAVQAEVLAAYEAAFRQTPVLLRYPAGDADPRLTSTARRKFGYHDDSFAWATLHTGKRDEEWFYMTALRAAGPAALERWKTHPIGGEIRPEAWGQVFDARPANPKIQNFRQCVEATHVSWLMDSGMFEKRQNAERVRRAETEVRRMGYEFHVPAVTVGPAAGGKLRVKVELENRGVAPFYYPWRARFGVLNAEGKLVKTLPGTGTLTGLLPGAAPRVWDEWLDLRGLAGGSYRLVVQVPNALPQGKPVRFANRAQDADVEGWLTLGPFEQ